jgi:hypothetical protein
MKRFFILLAIFFVMHHALVYLHEWTHSTIAWLAGYKSNPFAIYYGTEWFTLWDIDEAVPYTQILADAKPNVAATIAIAPVLLEVVLFLIGLKLLKLLTNWWAFAFAYWFTLIEISEVYDYIPIRTFSKSGDMHNFLSATGLSPYFLFIPGTFFVLWGILRMLAIEEPKACQKLGIQTKIGRFTFLLANILIFFGYYGGVGFLKTDPLSHYFSIASWIMTPLFLVIFWRKRVEYLSWDPPP